MKRYVYILKRILLYLLIFLLMREVFVKSDFGKSLDKSNKGMAVSVKEKIDKIFDFNASVPYVEKPQIPNVGITKSEKVRIPQFSGSGIPNVAVPKTEKVKVPRVDVPKVNIPR